ncbi:MAG: fused DNA polymerase IV/DNA polymerase III subunit alpha, partial [Verrucomicrobiota bacterium]
DQQHPDKRRRAYPFMSPRAFARQFADVPSWIEHTREIADRCSFAFEFGRLQFPRFQPPNRASSRDFLRHLVHHGANRKYGGKEPRVRAQIDTELAIIHDVGYEDYFLLVWDLLQDCRKAAIRWITRGSAADSLVCYCLGISNVCPIRFDLYFQRFLNRERMKLKKLPDIDIDFPHDRKDDVIDLILRKYGPDHAAVVGGFSTYQARSALADVAKVLGISEHQIRPITKLLPQGRAADIKDMLKNNPTCKNLLPAEEPYATAVELAWFLDGFPRYPKMHPCGVVLSREPMADLVPCFTSNKGYRTTQFDMDAVEAIGLVKLDILAQGGLSVMRDVERMLTNKGRAIPPSPTVPVRRAETSPTLQLDYHDSEVWEMIASGGARAVHHIESPAMVNLCKMCDVRDIDTLITVVSVIRPGAANEHKKQTFTRRYQGMEPIAYPHPSLEGCLKSTYGLIVYEEQVLQICEAFAGIPPGEGDLLRKALVRQYPDRIDAFGRIFYREARRQHRDEPIRHPLKTVKTGIEGSKTQCVWKPIDQPNKTCE